MSPDSPQQGTSPGEPTGVISPKLLNSYLSAEYVIHLDSGDIVMKIGERPANILRRQSWSIITAQNPCSMPHTQADNRARQQRLAAMLDTGGYQTLPATGRSTDGPWQEASLLVLGIPRESAKAFGARFGQNAVVFAEAGGLVELLLCHG
jgi:hypothetical protein